MRARNAAGVLLSGSTPCCASAATTSGLASALAVSRANCSTIAGSVPPVVNSPYQLEKS